MITTYDKFRNRKFDLDLPVHIFGTSSAGNSVYLSGINTLIDLGLPYNRYKQVSPDFFLEVDFIILTHIHGDHLNPATLKHIMTAYPHIKILLSTEMAQDIQTTPRVAKTLTPEFIQGHINQFRTAQPCQLQSRKAPFELITHKVPHGEIVNIAIEIRYHNKHILYSSDIDTLDDLSTQNSGYDGIPHPNFNDKFDIAFLEANYDADLLNKALAENPNDIKAKGNLRHMSEQEAWAYIQRYLKDDGIFIPLHASSTFGTLIQQL